MTREQAIKKASSWARSPDADDTAVVYYDGDGEYDWCTGEGYHHPAIEGNPVVCEFDCEGVVSI
jgi:hypothetical protein